MGFLTKLFASKEPNTIQIYLKISAHNVKRTSILHRFNNQAVMPLFCSSLEGENANPLLQELYFGD